MINKDFKLFNKINIRPIKSINCGRGQIVSKGLQAEALTIEDRDDLFHQHRSNRSAAGNIPQLIRAPSLTACIGHFHAISSLHQWCMLHQVDLTVSTVKSLTRLTSPCLRILNWWILTFQWGGLFGSSVTRGKRASRFT